jgi:hypothetical protein
MHQNWGIQQDKRTDWTLEVKFSGGTQSLSSAVDYRMNVAFSFLRTDNLALQQLFVAYAP